MRLKQPWTLNLQISEKVYKALYVATARYKVLYGGRGSGKSWAIADYILVRCAEKKIRVLCTRQFQSSIKHSVHKLLSDRIFTLGLQQYFTIKQDSIVSFCGSEIIFHGIARSLDDIKSTEGIDICWIEEAQFVTEKAFIDLIPTIRKEGSEIVVSFNPDTEKDATYARFIKNTPPDAIVTKINYYDNPFFPEVLRKEMEYMKATDYDLYLNVWEGEVKSFSDALVFRGKYRVAEFPEYRPSDGKIYVGLDFGFDPDPMACVRSFIRNDCLYVEHEAYGTSIDIDHIPDTLDRSIPLIRRSEIIADSARKEIIANLKRKGFNIKGCYKYSATAGAFIEDGINFMRSFREIIIHPRCTNTITEFGLYRQKIDKNTQEILPDIIDKNNHTIDAIRYSLESFIRKKISILDVLR